VLLHSHQQVPWTPLLMAVLVSGQTDGRRDHCLLALWAWKDKAHLQQTYQIQGPKMRKRSCELDHALPWEQFIIHCYSQSV